jgi:hypothetical protein
MAKIAHTGFVINDGAGVNDHPLTHPCGGPKVCRMRNQGTHADAGRNADIGAWRDQRRQPISGKRS